MPEQEFEIYLSLLSRLLRLSPAQKAAISDELRDHLEQRLSDLLQTGMSREDAIKTAMEEFGDVTGLALDLTRVSRTPLKTVVVRSTVVASITAAAIVCWISLFAPEHRIAAPPVLQAQPAKSATDTAGKPQEQAAKQRLQPLILPDDQELFPAFLAKTTDVEFAETPLVEVCSHLEDLVGVPIMLHRAALTDEGIAADQPVTLAVKGLTFEEVLNHITRQSYLTWLVDGGIVRITTPSSTLPETRHFDLRKLAKQGHSLGALVHALRLAGDEWSDDGGMGTTALIGESVVVRQTYQHQRRIAQMLAAIEQHHPMTALGTCTARDRLLAALQEPSQAQFNAIPLAEVMNHLAEMHHVPILVDTQSLQDEGNDREQTVSMNVKNRPLGKLLELLLAELDLTYQVRDGVIRITTTSKANEDMMWIVYNVQDLAPTDELLTQLSDAILHTTNGQWIDVDGEGGQLAQTDVGACLLVKQTDQIHTDIQVLLEQLRRSRTDPPAEAGKAQSKLVTRSYRMPTEIAGDLLQTLPSLVVPDSWTPLNGESRTIHLVASVPQMDEVNGVVSGGTHEVQVINPTKEQQPQGPGRPDASQTKSIVVRPRSMLIIRQTPQAHREIQKFLKNLTIFVDIGELESGTHKFSGGGGGGGFF